MIFPLVFRQKAAELIDEAHPCGFLLEQDVISAFQRNKSRVRKKSRELASLTESGHCITRSVEYENRHLHVGQNIGYIDGRRSREESRADFR